ncbi:Lcl domain-containing protein [Pseudomonas gingeri]
MKPEMITLKHGDATIKMPSSSLAKLAMASVFAQVLPPAANVQPVEPAGAPEIGHPWPGQGGINGGLVHARGDVPAHYLIIAAKDVGSLEWGGRGVEVKGLSKTDGYTNTQVLIGNDDKRKYPAADACAEYQADGHHDFYLPAAAELYEIWLNCPEVFAQDCYYWSSSQRSANTAFHLDFEDGTQYHDDKSNELRVRPVRRLFI